MTLRNDHLTHFIKGLPSKQLKMNIEEEDT